MLSRTIDTLAIKETGVDSSIQNDQVSLPGYTLGRKEKNRSGVFLPYGCFEVKASVPEPEIEKANVQARVPERNSHVFNLSNCSVVFNPLSAVGHL